MVNLCIGEIHPRECSGNERQLHTNYPFPTTWHSARRVFYRVEYPMTQPEWPHLSSRSLACYSYRCQHRQHMILIVLDHIRGPLSRERRASVHSTAVALEIIQPAVEAPHDQLF